MGGFSQDRCGLKRRGNETKTKATVGHKGLMTFVNYAAVSPRRWLPSTNRWRAQNVSTNAWGQRLLPDGKQNRLETGGQCVFLSSLVSMYLSRKRQLDLHSSQDADYYFVSNLQKYGLIVKPKPAESVTEAVGRIEPKGLQPFNPGILCKATKPAERSENDKKTALTAQSHTPYGPRRWAPATLRAASFPEQQR